MKLGIRLNLAGLSLPDTIKELDKSGTERSRKAMCYWVKKGDLQPADDARPNHVALYETVIRTNGRQYCLSPIVNLDTNKILGVRCL